MLVERILRNGFTVSPLLEAPWVTKDIFRPDWLHGADLGVSPLLLGNMFWHAIRERDYLDGSTRKERCASLWKMIQAYYVEEDVADRLGSFNVSTIKADKKGPALACISAACVRALVPFGRKLAEHMVSVCDTPVTQAMCAAARACTIATRVYRRALPLQRR